MRTRFLGAAAVVCLVAAVAFAQTGLAGQWETDPPAVGAGGRGAGGGGGRGGAGGTPAPVTLHRSK